MFDTIEFITMYLHVPYLKELNIKHEEKYTLPVLSYGCETWFLIPREEYR
jgi:hypothetical protein